MLNRAFSELAASPEIKPVVWIGSARHDLIEFPEEVVRAMGFALYEAQKCDRHPHATPLLGFGGTGVLELVEEHDGDTYSTVHTMRLAGRVYVLHAFQKKSRHGISTPKAEIDLIRARLRRAEEQHATVWNERKG